MKEQIKQILLDVNLTTDDKAFKIESMLDEKIESQRTELNVQYAVVIVTLLLIGIGFFIS